MKWIIQWRESYTVLRFEGDLMVGATQFFETGVMPWLKVPFAPIVLDLSDLKILASAGLGSLLKIREAADNAEAHLVMVRPADQAWRALELARLNELFAHADSVEAAAELVTGMST